MLAHMPPSWNRPSGRRQVRVASIRRSTPGSSTPRGQSRLRAKVAVAAHGPAEIHVRAHADEARWRGRDAPPYRPAPAGPDRPGRQRGRSSREPGVEPQVLERGLGGGARILGPGLVQPRPPGIRADRRPRQVGQAIQSTRKRSRGLVQHLETNANDRVKVHPPGARSAADLGRFGLIDAQGRVEGRMQGRQRPRPCAPDRVLRAHLPQGHQRPDGGLDIGRGAGLRVVAERQRITRRRFNTRHIANDPVSQPGRGIVEAIWTA